MGSPATGLRSWEETTMKRISGGCNLAICLDNRPHVPQPACTVPCVGAVVCPEDTACGLAANFWMNPVYACIPEGAECDADQDCLFGVCAPNGRCAAQCIDQLIDSLSH